MPYQVITKECGRDCLKADIHYYVLFLTDLIEDFLYNNPNGGDFVFWDEHSKHSILAARDATISYLQAAGWYAAPNGYGTFNRGYRYGIKISSNPIRPSLFKRLSRRLSRG